MVYSYRDGRVDKKICSFEFFEAKFSNVLSTYEVVKYQRALSWSYLNNLWCDEINNWKENWTNFLTDDYKVKVNVILFIVDHRHIFLLISLSG